MSRKHYSSLSTAFAAMFLDTALLGSGISLISDHSAWKCYVAALFILMAFPNARLEAHD